MRRVDAADANHPIEPLGRRDDSRDAPVYNGSSRVGISTLQVGDHVRVTGTIEHDYVVATEVRVSRCGTRRCIKAGAALG